MTQQLLNQLPTYYQQVDADLFVVNAIDATTGTTTTTSTPATALLTTGTPYYGEHEEVARISQPWSSCTTNLEAGCLYIAQVYIPRDSATLGGGGSNSRSSSFSAAIGTAFSISVEKETQDDDTGFATDLMFMSAALTILLLCVLSSALVFCRARIEVFRRRHQAEQQAALAAAQAHGEGTTQIAVARGEQRGVTTAQMKRLSIFKYTMQPRIPGRNSSSSTKPQILTQREDGGDMGEDHDNCSQHHHTTIKQVNLPPSEDHHHHHHHHRVPTCSICIMEFEVGERIIKLPCGHEFHGECVTAWVEAKHRCPLCRQHIDTAQDRKMTSVGGGGGRSSSSCGPDATTTTTTTTTTTAAATNTINTSGNIEGKRREPSSTVELMRFWNNENHYSIDDDDDDDDDDDKKESGGGGRGRESHELMRWSPSQTSLDRQSKSL